LTVIRNEYRYTSQLHPAVLELGREYALGTIRGGNARCRAMLQTFADIILEDYVPPPTSIVADYRTHLDQTVLKPSFTYWTTQCRPHSVSMGNAFTFLKSAVASLDRDLPYHVPTATTKTTTTRATPTGVTTTSKEDQNQDGTTAKDKTTNNDDDDDDEEVPCAKRLLQESIQQFIQERLEYADQAIAQHAFTKIERGDVLMTFGYSEIISVLIDTAARELRGKGGISGDGKATPSTSSFATSSSSSSSSCSPFFVWVVDAPPLWEGRQLIQQLQFWNIPCGYITLNALGLVMDQNQQTKNKQVTKVFLGASALLTNGSVFGRAGTACVALLAQDYHIPVLVCCETYKISNRVPLLESITHNELGNPESLLVAPPHGGGRGGVGESSLSAAAAVADASSSSLSDWKTVPHLKLLHLLYDVTPSDFISAIITEVGIIPPTSVAVLLREMNPQDSAVE
jgi:translation initiation factor eIF-2B subunit delta